jgi:hypothetical protein
MHIKFLNHGKGSAARAAAYLLDDKDHQNLDRSDVSVLRGDPYQFAAIADSLPFAQRYTSAVIAWHPDDQPNVQDIEHTLAEFERVAFAGLEPDQYHLLAVQHDEPDGAKHLHILVPRVDLHSGKSMNIAPPGWKNTFDPLRDALNNENGWARPDDLHRQRIYQPQHSAYKDAATVRAGLQVEPDPKALIAAYLVQRVNAGQINDRAGVIASLAELGDITRQGKDYISIKPEGFDKAIRLKGALYDKEFNAGAWAEAAREDQQRHAAAHTTREPITAEHRERAATAREKLECAIEQRTAYNQQRYGRDQQQHEPEPKAAHRRAAAVDERAAEHDYERVSAATARDTAATPERQHPDDLDDQNTLSRLVHRFTGTDRGHVDSHPQWSDVYQQHYSNSAERSKMGISAGSAMAGLQIRQSDSALQTNQIKPQDNQHDRTGSLAIEAIRELEQLFHRTNERAKRDHAERKRELERTNAAARERRTEHAEALRQTLANTGSKSEFAMQWGERFSRIAGSITETLDRAAKQLRARIEGLGTAGKQAQRTAAALDHAIQGNYITAGKITDATDTLQRTGATVTKHVEALERQKQNIRTPERSRGIGFGF